jgi:hypothetical protein
VVELDIILYYTDEVIDGFDFLIEYDTEYLTFASAAKGDLFGTCEWEYFAYVDESGDTRNNFNSQGLVRVVAVADTGAGDPHPNPECITYLEDEIQAATLTFQVSDNPANQGTYIPVRFYWMNCADNIAPCSNPMYKLDKSRSTCATISSTDSAYICDYVYDVDGSLLTDRDFGFPGGFGPPDDCFVYGNPLPIPLIHLRNGSIYVACPGGGDANGDEIINVGDPVFLINYVFKGGPAPDPLEEGDANCDGTVNVGDAVYLINHVFKGGPGPCIECP